MTTKQHRTLTDTLRNAHAATSVAPSRRGWLIYLDQDTAKRLKIAAAKHDTTLQAIGEEAADLMLQRYP